MYDPQVDLGTLSRSPQNHLSHTGLARPISGRHAVVPQPPSRWKTRILLPMTIIGAFAGVLLYALRDSLIPAQRVTVIPVVVKSAAGGGASGVVTQAAGWVEPDPYPIYVSALTDGIVKEVTVLEGQTDEAGERSSHA